MALDISAETPRVQYTVTSADSTFDYDFEIFQDSDIKVFVDSTLKTLTTHYTVSGAGTTGGGTVTMTSGNAVTNATVTLVRDITIQRTTDFPASGAFQVDSLNTELDRITAVQQTLEDNIARSLRLADEDATSTLTLPLKDARKGRYLAFNATTGNAEAGPTQTDATLIATVTTDIALLADIQDGTTATNTLTTLSPKATEIGLLGNSTTVANMGLLGTSAVITDMGLLGTSAVVEDMGFLGTSANVTAMGHLGTSANVTAMGKLGNDATVADMAILGTDDVVADMNTLATSDIISDLNTLATSDIVTDMNLLATSANVTAMGHLGTSANVTAMGLLGTSAVVEDMGFLGTSANVTAMGNLGTSTVVGHMANLNASGVITNIANLNATDVITNIGTVASNVSGVNSFADRYRIASSAPTSSLDVGDLYFDTTANELKVYKASGWSAAGSTVNGTSARFHYDISGTPSSVSGGDSAGNTLAYDAGFVDVYVNGVRMAPEDITVTSGTSVVFASALADGDDVDIVAFGTFSVANIVSTGALNSGSITSGFGNIDNGSSTITTTGAISGGTLTGTLQTTSQTNITGVGALNAGSITSGFGAIDVGSSAITTTGAGTFGSLDINGGEVILDADADTSITADTDDKIQIKIGGTDKIKIDGTGSETTIFHIGDSTPLSFGTGYNEAVLSVGEHFGIYSDNNGSVNTSEMMINCYNDGSNRVYANSGRHAQRVQFDTYNGNMHFSVSNATGNADANVTFVNALSLANSSGTATFTSASNGNGNINFYNNAMYIKSNTGEVYATDSSGNHSLLSPHNFKYIPDGKSSDNAWSYLSEKTTLKKETITETIDGKEVSKEVTSERKDGDSFTYVNVDMMKVVREVEKLTGTKLVYTGTDGKDDGSTVKDDIIAGLVKRIEALETA